MYKRMKEAPPSPSNSTSGPPEVTSTTDQPPGGHQQTPGGATQIPIFQSGQPVILIQYGNSRTDISRYNAKAAIILGAIQIAAGMCGLIINILGIILHTHITFVGYGIWGGILVSNEIMRNKC